MKKLELLVLALLLAGIGGLASASRRDRGHGDNRNRAGEFYGVVAAGDSGVEDADGGFLDAEPADSGEADAAASDVGNGTETFDRQWDIVYTGVGCATTPDWNTMVDIYATYQVDLPEDATDQDYVCNQSTAGINAACLGSSLTNEGVLHGDTTASCWLDSTSTVPSLLDGEDLLVRIFFQSEIQSTTNRMLAWGAGTEFWYIAENSSERITSVWRESALAIYTCSHGTTLTNGADYKVDVWYDAVAAGGNPQVTICVMPMSTGVDDCDVCTEHTANFAAFSAAGPFSFQGDNGCAANPEDQTIYFVGVDYANTWWNQTESGEASSCVP